MAELLAERVDDLATVEAEDRWFYEQAGDGYRLNDWGVRFNTAVADLSAKHAERMAADRAECAEIKARNLALVVDLEMGAALRKAGVVDVPKAVRHLKADVRRWPQFFLVEREGALPTARTAEGATVASAVFDLLNDSTVIPLPRRVANPWAKPPRLVEQLAEIARDPANAARLAIEAGVPPSEVWWAGSKH